MGKYIIQYNFARGGGTGTIVVVKHDGSTPVQVGDSAIQQLKTPVESSKKLNH
jgi:hypothetical protein